MNANPVLASIGLGDKSALLQVIVSPNEMTRLQPRDNQMTLVAVLVCSNITAHPSLVAAFLKGRGHPRTMLGQGRLILRDSPLERGQLGNGGLATQKPKEFSLAGHIEPSCDQSPIKSEVFSGPRM